MTLRWWWCFIVLFLLLFDGPSFLSFLHTNILATHWFFASTKGSVFVFLPCILPLSFLTSRIWFLSLLHCWNRCCPLWRTMNTILLFTQTTTGTCFITSTWRSITRDLSVSLMLVIAVYETTRDWVLYSSCLSYRLLVSNQQSERGMFSRVIRDELVFVEE